MPGEYEATLNGPDPAASVLSFSGSFFAASTTGKKNIQSSTRSSFVGWVKVTRTV